VVVRNQTDSSSGMTIQRINMYSEKMFENQKLNKNS